MSQTAKAQEPSMEEILASIRRIIADDEGKPARAAEPAPPPPPPKPQVAAAPSRPAPPPIVNTQSEVDAMLAGAEPPKPLPKAEPRAEPKPAASDVLDLTEANVAAKPPPGPAPSFRTIDGDTDVVFTDRAPEPLPEPPRFAEDMLRKPAPPAAMPPGMTGPAAMPDRSLLSNNAASAVDSAFNALAATVLGQNARTLEDLVKEMLRPMLKTWLDDNLPNLVERIVRAEIERVSRGR
jgi:hypothetical protein